MVRPLSGPVHRAPEEVGAVLVQDEAPVDHDAEVVQAADHSAEVPVEVSGLVALPQVGRAVLWLSREAQIYENDTIVSACDLLEF